MKDRLPCVCVGLLGVQRREIPGRSIGLCCWGRRMRILNWSLPTMPQPTAHKTSAWHMPPKYICYHRNKENVGAARNWYYVFELCQSEYFEMGRARRYLRTGILQRCVAFLDQHPATILCYAKTRVIDGQGKIERDFAEERRTPRQRRLTRRTT